MNLTRLQRNLYRELEQATSVEAFNKGYKELINNIPRATQAYYDKKFVFTQGMVKGTPANLPVENTTDIIIKAGYKQPDSDRAWISLNKVMGVLYTNLFKEGVYNDI